jgi:hypothetical protein
VIKVKTNIPRVQRYLKDLADNQIDRVIRETINDVAFEGRVSEVVQMHKDLDRPTPFTANKNAMLVQKARRGVPQARVVIKRIQAEYLRWQIFGGTKRGGRGGVPVGPSTQRNQYGNTPGYRKFITTRKGKRETFRIVNPDEVKKGRGQPGIYRKYKTKPDKLVMSFVKKTRYRKRYRWGAGFERYAKFNAASRFRHHARRIKSGPTR